MLAERKKDGLADVVDEGAVKAALALARVMKEQLSDRDQTSGRLELAGVPSFHAMTRADFDAMSAGGVERTGAIARVNASTPIPLLSVVKVPVALAVLDAVDKGRYSLTSPITLLGADLHPRGERGDRYPHGGGPGTP